MQDNNEVNVIGFEIVLRRKNHFISISQPMHIRGFLPEEIWIFGIPNSGKEVATWNEVQPVLNLIKKRNLIHFIPENTEFSATGQISTVVYRPKTRMEF